MSNQTKFPKLGNKSWSRRVARLVVMFLLFPVAALVVERLELAQELLQAGFRVVDRGLSGEAGFPEELLGVLDLNRLGHV